mmetsp:Transcript_17093/g.29559  ORF Transcript_17093/g.29559 Transcript_17093/m.29559 type:complete len:203 (-) Transcript_17093:191-799(-)
MVYGRSGNTRCCASLGRQDGAMQVRQLVLQKYKCDSLLPVDLSERGMQPCLGLQNLLAISRIRRSKKRSTRGCRLMYNVGAWHCRHHDVHADEEKNVVRLVPVQCGYRERMRRRKWARLATAVAERVAVTSCTQMARNTSSFIPPSRHSSSAESSSSWEAGARESHESSEGSVCRRVRNSLSWSGTLQDEWTRLSSESEYAM